MTDPKLRTYLAAADPSIKFEDLPSDACRGWRMALRGEPFGQRELRREAGSVQLSALVRKMETIGFTFTREKNMAPGAQGNERLLASYCCTNPQHVPDGVTAAAPNVPKRSTNGHSKEVVPRARARKNGKGSIMPVPEFSGSVEVFLLAHEDDGSIRMGLRNEASKWLVTVEGHQMREVIDG